jgi:hypothetical protein
MHTTQTDQIFEWLKAGNSITALEALYKFGSLRCAARIAEIKELAKAEGYSVSSTMIQIPETKKKVAQYKLVKAA